MPLEYVSVSFKELVQNRQVGLDDVHGSLDDGLLVFQGNDCEDFTRRR